MHLDIVCSLVIYAFATIAFYLLGAGVLHRLGLAPTGSEMITVLSRIYTDTLGEWALWLFYLGAVVTLYGTIFASTAAHSRLFADLVRIGGVFPRCGLEPAWLSVRRLETECEDRKSCERQKRAVHGELKRGGRKDSPSIVHSAAGVAPARISRKEREFRPWRRRSPR